jgi:hypothetical protein
MTTMPPSDGDLSRGLLQAAPPPPSSSPDDTDSSSSSSSSSDLIQLTLSYADAITQHCLSKLGWQVAVDTTDGGDCCLLPLGRETACQSQSDGGGGDRFTTSSVRPRALYFMTRREARKHHHLRWSRLPAIADIAMCQLAWDGNNDDRGGRHLAPQDRIRRSVVRQVDALRLRLQQEPQQERSSGSDRQLVEFTDPVCSSSSHSGVLMPSRVQNGLREHCLPADLMFGCEVGAAAAAAAAERGSSSGGGRSGGLAAADGSGRASDREKAGIPLRFLSVSRVAAQTAGSDTAAATAMTGASTTTSALSEAVICGSSGGASSRGLRGYLFLSRWPVVVDNGGGDDVGAGGQRSIWSGLPSGGDTYLYTSIKPGGVGASGVAAVQAGAVVEGESVMSLTSLASSLASSCDNDMSDSSSSVSSSAGSSRIDDDDSDDTEDGSRTL